MHDRVISQSPLLRLPRELRDAIFTHAFWGYGHFPQTWSNVDVSDQNALFYELPGMCQASRQLFHEATPIFLKNCWIESWNMSTSRNLLNFYSQFPYNEAAKDVEVFSLWNWTDDSTAIHLELISKFTNLESLEITFSFPTIIDGTPMDKFNYTNEQYYWCETGLNYKPPKGQSIEEEKAILGKDLEEFITTHGLDRIIEMPNFRDLEIQFAVNDGGEATTSHSELYRHRLCNPLWRWATKNMKEKWGVDAEDGMDAQDGRGQFFVSTNLQEEYESVNMISEN
jgi:hypothetical protein